MHLRSLCCGGQYKLLMMMMMMMMMMMKNSHSCTVQTIFVDGHKIMNIN